MNYRKLFIGLVISTALSLIMVELYWKRYADTKVEMGAGFIIGIFTVALKVLAFLYAMPDKTNCSHDWQPNDTYSMHGTDKCIKCYSTRKRP